MKDKIKKIEKVAIANGSLSRLERRKILNRLQRKQPFKTTEINSDRLFQVQKQGEVQGTSTGNRYPIKKSLSSGTLRLGAEIVGAVDGNGVVVYPPPQGLEFAPEPEIEDLPDEPTRLSLAIKIGFV